MESQEIMNKLKMSRTAAVWTAIITTLVALLVWEFIEVITWPSDLHFSMSNPRHVNALATPFGYKCLLFGFLYAVPMAVGIIAVLLCIFVQSFRRHLPLWVIFTFLCLLGCILSFMGFYKVVGQWM